MWNARMIGRSTISFFSGGCQGHVWQCRKNGGTGQDISVNPCQSLDAPQMFPAQLLVPSYLAALAGASKIKAVVDKQVPL